MKFQIAICLLAVFGLSKLTFAQKEVNIGSQETKVYPFDLNQSFVFADWVKTPHDFDSVLVYGMGEATHGTREFFDIKAKTFEYLVTHCNYKVFGLEASYGECCFINDYIQSGAGDIDTIMQYLTFWTWRTEEVKDLILWMKDYNLRQPDSAKISFYGFDMQSAYTPLRYFVDFLRKDGFVNASELDEITKVVLTKSYYYYSSQRKDSAISDTLNTVLKELNEWIDRNEVALSERYPAKKHEQLLFCISNFAQAIQNIKAGYDYRDRCMAGNVMHISRAENKKMFIWAHNGHIGTAYSPSYKRASGKPMGWYLREGLGRRYYAVGFVFNEGSFQACYYEPRPKTVTTSSRFGSGRWRMTFGECYLPVSKKNKLTKALSMPGIENYFIDLRATQNPVFSKPLQAYSIGAVFNGKKFSSTLYDSKGQFDGLIYISKTTRAKPVWEPHAK